jgi:ATP-dependent DNA ligase
MLPQIKPINPLRIKVPFDDPEFIAELKHDGFRALAYIESGGRCRRAIPGLLRAGPGGHRD